MSAQREESFDLRRERMNRGLSLRQAGVEIGVAPGTIGRLETGDYRVHPATAKKIADFFDIQVTDLIPIPEAA